MVQRSGAEERQTFLSTRSGGKLYYFRPLPPRWAWNGSFERKSREMCMCDVSIILAPFPGRRA